MDLWRELNMAWQWVKIWRRGVPGCTSYGKYSVQELNAKKIQNV